MPSDEAQDGAKKYANCMDRVRFHLSTVEGLFSKRIRTGYQDLTVELIFLHFRKALEEMAFSSLCANVEKYSAAHAKFASFWQAKNLLKEIGQINPHFYPVPIHFREGIHIAHHADPGQEDYLTKDDFNFLYSQCSEVLHSRNPYRTDSTTIDVKRTVPDWIDRFRRLLTLHCIQLVDHEELWSVMIPGEGPVQVAVSRLVEPSPPEL